MWHEEPTAYTADDVAGRKRNVDVEGLEFGETGSFEEDDGVAEDGVSAEDLGGPYYAVLLR